jgi:two-component system chemotaxis response regulator CheB
VLGAKTALRVREAEDKEVLARGHVYIAPPNYHLLVERGGTLALSADGLLHFSRPAIDVLFESAADAYGPALAGVVLTGGSEDGANGLATIARRGGTAIVQSPEEAVAPYMPQSAIARVPTARVLPLAGIAALLAELTRPARPRHLEATRW